MTKVTVNPQEKEIVILKGKALDPKPPVQIDIKGTLPAVTSFLISKKDNYQVKDCHVLVSIDKGEITFIGNEKSPYFDQVKGVLELSSELQKWPINKDRRFTHNEFKKHIKMNKFHFANPEDATTLIVSLEKWSAKITTTLKDFNDNSGNSLYELEKKVEGVELKRKFQLSIPLYKGYPKSIFDVEIGLEPTPSAVNIYLISDQLDQLIYEHKDRYLSEQMKQIYEIFSCAMIQS